MFFSITRIIIAKKSHCEILPSRPRHLRLVEYGRDAVGGVDDTPCVAGHDEEEPVGGLQDQVLELLVREERRLVGAVGVAVARACNREEEFGAKARLK